MNNKIKLLVFSQSAVGGAERMSVTVTKTLDRDRFEVKYVLVGSTLNGKAPLQEFIPEDISVLCIPNNGALKMIYSMYKILKKEKPNVVFASVLNLNNKLLLLRNLFKKTKFIARCDNYLYTYTDKQRAIIKHTYYKADVIIAQTDEMMRELVDEIKIPKNKVVVLQNPVDTETIDKNIAEGVNPYPNDNKIRYVAIGRFAYQKGFDLLIEAFAEVKKLEKNSELYIVGKNDEFCQECYDEVYAIIKRFNLEDSVHCVGFKSNPYVYIKYADCFVLSSRWEGLPNVMIESLYLGTPVAAYKCIPVIERIVTNGVDGYLAEKEDISSLSKAMLYASKLGRISSAYKSAKVEDFHNLLIAEL